jgi:ABC-2 type transport system ATP-binding protein
MPAIFTRGLRRAFGPTIAVDSLDLEVDEGSVFGLVGPDGAGKTTTMRMLAGILDPTDGEAEVAGCDVRRHPESVKHHIGYVSQRFGLYPDLTVIENIDFYADIFSVPKKGRSEKTERLLGFSNLTPFKRRLAGNLSGGMKQKLGLACALIHTPRVLLLDEPTNGVDPVSRRDFWRILYQLLREGVTIFVSTAYLDEAERCNKIALIDKGRVLGTGSPEDIRSMLHGVTLEIHASEPRHAARTLRQNLSKASVALYGDRLHITTAETDAGGVRSILSGAGIQVSELRPIEPSLEDVFVGVVAQNHPDHARRAPDDKTPPEGVN